LGCQGIGNIGGFVLQNVLFGFVIQRPLYWIPLILSVFFGTAIIKIHQIFEKTKRIFLLEPLPLLFKKSKDLRFSKFDFEKPTLWPFEIKSRLWIGIFLGIHSEDGLDISKLQYEYTYAVCIYIYILIYIYIDMFFQVDVSKHMNISTFIHHGSNSKGSLSIRLHQLSQAYG